MPRTTLGDLSSSWMTTRRLHIERWSRMTLNLQHWRGDWSQRWESTSSDVKTSGPVSLTARNDAPNGDDDPESMQMGVVTNGYSTWKRKNNDSDWTQSKSIGKYNDKSRHKTQRKRTQEQGQGQKQSKRHDRNWCHRDRATTGESVPLDGEC